MNGNMWESREKVKAYSNFKHLSDTEMIQSTSVKIEVKKCIRSAFYRNM